MGVEHLLHRLYLLPAISCLLGLGCFFAFCSTVSLPVTNWTSSYARATEQPRSPRRRRRADRRSFRPAARAGRSGRDDAEGFGDLAAVLHEHGIER